MNLYEIMYLSIFDMIMIVLISASLVNLEKIKLRRTIFFILLGVILTSLNSVFINAQEISHIFSTVINFIWLKIFIKDKKLKLNDYMLVFIITFIIMFIIELFGVVSIRIISHNFEYSFIYGLKSQIIALIICITICKYIPIENLFTFIEQKNIVFKVLIINLYILYFLISIIWYIKIEYILESIISIIVILLLSLVINIIFLRDGLINQANQEKLQTLETYLPIIENIMEEFRAKQHDYHNHIQLLLTMQENPCAFDSDVYNDYAHQIVSQDIWTYLIKLDNKIIMAFLYSKYKSAKEEGIIIQYDINNFLLKSEYTDYELVEMYGILIDNAIEHLKICEKKDITILLDFKNGMNFFSVINNSKHKTPLEVSKMFNNGYSTNADEGRGVGLYKLKLMIEKRKGTITAYYDTKNKSMIFELLHK